MQEPPLDVTYIGSYSDVKSCPEPGLPEYCFIGRSNVGKSSLINLLTGRKEIARTSKKPGKTQSINLFRVGGDPEWMIADLPGYGFAQVAKSTRGAWSGMITTYVLQRRHLVCTFLLVDIRHPMQENDRQFFDFLGTHDIPFCILFTKSDKLKPAQLALAVETYQQQLLLSWETLPAMVVTSSMTGKGRDAILDHIRRWNAIFAAQAHPDRK